MRKSSSVGAVLVTTLLAAPAAAPAAVVDRVQVGAPGLAATRGFAENLSVVFASPDGYERGCCYDFGTGQWLGPRYSGSAAPSVQHMSRIDWDVEHLRTRRSLASVARSTGFSGYPEARGEKVRVRHVVAGRTVGRLEGFVAIDVQPLPGARVQAAVAIDLGRRVKSAVLFDVAEPEVDNDPISGTYTVNGTPAPAWNRAQADSVVRSVFVEGNLPPRKVKARASGRSITGSVRDRFRDPVSEVKLTLQRRAGSRWVKAGTGTSRTDGKYELTAPQPGRYRVVAKLDGTQARSAGVQVA